MCTINLQAAQENLLKRNASIHFESSMYVGIVMWHVAGLLPPKLLPPPEPKVSLWSGRNAAKMSKGANIPRTCVLCRRVNTEAVVSRQWELVLAAEHGTCA